MRALHAAVDAGVNFIDTADVYGDGHSERLVAQLRRERAGETIYVATKAGRRLPVQEASGYSRENLTAWVERSLRNLETDCLDLLQLHCPPSAVFADLGVYGILDDLVAAGKVRHYGVSVERVDEALEAIRHPGVKTRPDHLQHVPPAPGGGVLRRSSAAAGRDPCPRAAGQRTADRQADERTPTFAADDHRRFNREGEAFDKGETFSGVPYDEGLAAVEELRPLVPAGATLSALALRWILMFDAVTTAIPGARTPEQARSNAAAADLTPLDAADDRGGARHLRSPDPPPRPRPLVGPRPDARAKRAAQVWENSRP